MNNVNGENIHMKQKANKEDQEFKTNGLLLMWGGEVIYYLIFMVHFNKTMED